MRSPMFLHLPATSFLLPRAALVYCSRTRTRARWISIVSLCASSDSWSRTAGSSITWSTTGATAGEDVPPSEWDGSQLRANILVVHVMHGLASSLISSFLHALLNSANLELQQHAYSMMLELGELVSNAYGVCYTDWSINLFLAVPDIDVRFTICLESER